MRRRVVVALVAVLAAAAIGYAVTRPEEAKPEAPVLSAPEKGTTYLGEIPRLSLPGARLTIDGTLPGAGGRAVELVRKVGRGPWTHQEAMGADVEGGFAFEVVVPDERGRVNYRVVGPQVRTHHRETFVVPPVQRRTLDAGYSLTCSVGEDDNASCWGRNWRGGVGDGTLRHRAEPTEVVGGGEWFSVSVGLDQACGVRRDGSGWCWGSTVYGQVGDGTQGEPRSTPVQLSSRKPWAGFAAGRSHTCGIKVDGTAWCWGLNLSGEVGDGTRADRLLPRQVGRDGEWVQVSAGEGFSCGLKLIGTLWCWGSNQAGQLGDGSGEDSLRPVRVGDASDWVALESGVGGHTCAIRGDASAWCWGENGGALGDGTAADRYEPVQVAGSSRWRRVSPGDDFTCGVKAEGTLWCWGVDIYGATTHGSTTTAPTQVGDDNDWETVAAGMYHGCATKTDGSLWCWGYNRRGAIGVGTLDFETYPVTRVR